MVGRKQTATNKEFCEVWANVWKYVTITELKRWEHDTLTEMDRTLNQYPGLIGYGWSGGKDSLVIQGLMTKLGISEGVCGVMTPIEYPEYMHYVRTHLPSGVVLYEREDIDAAWVSENPRYLFPKTGRDGYWWTLKGTRWSQILYKADYSPSLMVWGRRYSDGNICGDRETGLQESGKVGLQYNPIREWSHELTMAYIQYHRYELPPIYDYPCAWTMGTGSWPSHRYAENDFDAFAIVAECDISCVIDAAPYFEDARRVLAGRGIT